MFICKLLSTGLPHQTSTIRMEVFAGSRKLRSNEATGVSTKQEEADMPAKYLKIANKLQEDIFQGLYNETGFLPTELEIAASNNVSRQTARNALAVLVSNGLIERRQGSGSRIVKQKKNPKSNSVAVVTTFLYINDYIFPNVLKDIQHSLSKKIMLFMCMRHKNRVDENERFYKNFYN